MSCIYEIVEEDINNTKNNQPWCICIYTYLALNRFEISVLRILAKKQNAMRISSLIEGFPDYYLDNVLLALSNLSYQGYILFSNHNNSQEARVYLNKDKRKEVLKIIDPLPNLSPATENRVIIDTKSETSSHYPYNSDLDKDADSINEQLKNNRKNIGSGFLKTIRNIVIPYKNHHQQYTNNTKKYAAQPVIIRSLTVLSLIVFGFISTLGIAEFSGDNYSTNIIYDRHLLKNHKDIEKPVKYQWHFEKEYYRDTNSSSSSSFIPPSHVQQASYRCSDEKNFSS